MAKIDPYANESDVVGIGDLEIENRLDRISIHGGLDLTKDKAGLKAARALKEIVDAAVAALAKADLPDRIETAAPKTVKNPWTR